MAEEKEVRKFRELLDDCMEKASKKLDFKEADKEKKEKMIDKFKKAMWR